jgi:aspartate aminotransferase
MSWAPSREFNVRREAGGRHSFDAGSVAANLDLDERVNRQLANGFDILHLGFGESRIPPPPALVDRLAAGVRLTDYGPVAGREGPREAVAGYFRRRRLPTTADDVVLAPGSKPLLLAIMASVPGDVVLPRPAWVTYAPQAQFLGRRVVSVPIPDHVGGVPDPDRLVANLASARASGANPQLMVLTAPDNPTGTTADPATVRRLMRIAEQEDLLVISDEIYRDVIFDGGTEYLSPAEVAPDRVVVVTGLSKSLALGGWRIGAARFPSSQVGQSLRSEVVGLASQIWSNAPGPMQAVAEYAFGEPPEIVAHRTASSHLHARVARAVHAAFVDSGALVREPSGGFYVYPDLTPMAAALRSLGVNGSADLERFLLDELGVAVLGGHHGGDDPAALRFRAATSLLYGHSEAQRDLALKSESPTELPHIAAALGRIRDIGPAIARMAGS